MNFGISLVSLLVCIAVGGLLVKLKYFRFLDERSSRFESLDGLRGFLAISVFFHHFAVTYHWKIHGIWTKPPPEIYYLNYGKVGVAIFFMITGFLFISKISKSNEKIDWPKLYESRFFRIVPLYLFALALISLIVFHNSEYQLNSQPIDLLKQYIRWMMFQGGSINNYPDTNIIIAGVEWTLRYEWLFYFLLPVLSIALWKGNIYTNLAVVVTIIYLYIHPVAFVIYPSADFSTSNFIFFAVGGLASIIPKINNININFVRSKTVSTIVLTLAFGCIFYPHTFDLIHIAIISILFFLVVLGNDLFGLFRLKSTKLLGEISYSIYLLHGMVLYILFSQIPIANISEMTPSEYALLMPFLSVAVVLVSSVTFLLVEKTSMDFGKKFLLSRSIYSAKEIMTKALHRRHR